MAVAATRPGVSDVRRPRGPSLLAAGAMIWLASELMFFGGLFAGYFTIRSQNSPWPPEDFVIEWAWIVPFTVVLLASSVTVHISLSAAERGDWAASRRWLLVTIVMGAAFLANLVREFVTTDVRFDTNVYGSVYWLLTGFHGLHVFAGVILLSLLLARMWGRPGGRRSHDSLQAGSYYWHFVDGVWIVLFTVLYVVQ